MFRQERLGKNGRRFVMCKFRSMRQGGESAAPTLLPRSDVHGSVFKLRSDPRVTSVGSWLRAWSLDELPQLWNVIRGDMSLVWPRPPLATEVLKYEPWQRRRLSMKPGMTGPWQVSGRSDVEFDEWMNLDLAYIDH